MTIPVLTVISHPNALTTNNTNPNILQETLLINSAPQYTDPGASAMDPEDGDISNSVQVSGDIVIMTIENTYLISYNVQDSNGNHAVTKYREITIVVLTANSFGDPFIIPMLLLPINVQYIE